MFLQSTKAEAKITNGVGRNYITAIWSMWEYRDEKCATFNVCEGLGLGVINIDSNLYLYNIKTVWLRILGTHHLMTQKKNP